MAGEVTALALLANTLLEWLTDPQGYARLTREKKIEAITKPLSLALNARDFAAADVCFEHLRRLSAETD